MPSCGTYQSKSAGLLSGFAAVSCVSSTACVGVGARRDGANRTFVAGWDGSAWNVAATPSPAGSNILAAVSCVRGEHGVECFAVGTSGPVFGISGKPAWAAFDINTGRLSGTPAAANAGTYANIVIVAYDGYMKGVLPAFSIVVQPAPAPVPSPVTRPSAAGAPSETTPPTTQMVPPPAKGMVWVNLDSKIFHREGDTWYGRTKHGQYMSEADALKAGYREAKKGGAHPKGTQP